MKWYLKTLGFLLLAWILGLGSMQILASEVNNPSLYEATMYSFQDLWQSAITASPMVQSQMREVQKLELDLKILLTNYTVKWNLAGETLFGLPNGGDKAGFQLYGDSQITWMLPAGLQLSIETTLSDLLNKKRDYTYSFRVRYPLLPGIESDPLLTAIKGKKRELEQAQAELRGEKDKVYIQLWGKFQTALILQKSLELMKEEVRSGQDKLARWKKLYEQSNITESDLYLQELNVTKNQAALEKISQEYTFCLLDLLKLAGFQWNDQMAIETLTGNFTDLTTKITLVGEVNLEQPVISIPPIEEMISTALAKSSEVKKAELALINMREVFLSKYAGSGIQLGSELILTDSPLAKNEWSVGLSASIELFDGKKQALEKEKDQLQLTELEETLSNTKLAVALEVNALRSKYTLALLEYQSANLEYRQVKLDYTCKQEQENQGLLSEMEIRNFQRLMYQKELIYLQKLVDVWVSYWELSQLTNLHYQWGGV